MMKIQIGTEPHHPQLFSCRSSIIILTANCHFVLFFLHWFVLRTSNLQRKGLEHVWKWSLVLQAHTWESTLSLFCTSRVPAFCDSCNDCFAVYQYPDQSLWARQQPTTNSTHMTPNQGVVHCTILSTRTTSKNVILTWDTLVAGECCHHCANLSPQIFNAYIFSFSGSWRAGHG